MFFTMFGGLVASGEKSERTLDGYQQRYRTHIEPRLGGKKLQKLTASDVSRMLAELRKQGLSPWTVRKVFDLLSVILNRAVSQEIIDVSPLDRIDKSEKPKGKNQTKARNLTNAERVDLIESALPGYRAIIATAVTTGMRLSELLGLRWQDVDFENGLIRVRHQLSRATRERPARLLPLKTDAGERVIDELADELLPLLRKHRAEAFRLRHARPEDFVFATLTGAPMYCRNVSERGIGKAADRAGLNPAGVPKLGMHDLRHTAISHWIAAGLDVVTVQRRAGHARPSITLDLYSHEFGEANRSAETRARLRAVSSLGIRPKSDQTPDS
jgi:integrase